jgi:phosphoglycolate phosphatase-like HAD superfamily hydrolase
MKYKCLILDHDDTSVESSPKVHYPAFIESMKTLRPSYLNMTLEEYFIKNFEPGFGKFLKEELKFSEDDWDFEYKVWRSYTEMIIPDFFPGFIEVIKKFKKLGGIVTVVSHSEKDIIERDYKKNACFMPDMIFGWDNDETKRKPGIFPVMEILKTFNLKKDDVLIVDDLKPGLEMAKNSGVKIAGAGWGNKVELIVSYMKKNCDFYFDSIDSFEKFLFS